MRQLTRLPAAEPLKRNPDAVEKPGEIYMTGTIYGAGKRLPPLNEGVTLYVIWSDGVIGLSPRTPRLNVDPKQPGAQYYASHRSVIRKRDTKAEIVAAGEIHVINGKVSVLSDRAGTYPDVNLLGSLKHAEQVLSLAGLPITPRTRRVHYELKGKQNIEPHAEAHERALWALKIEKSPRLKSIQKKIQRLFKKLSERYPHPNAAGLVDTDKLIDTVLARYRKGVPVFEKADLRLELGFYIGSLNKDGVDYIVNKYFRLTPIVTPRPRREFDQIMELLEGMTP